MSSDREAIGRIVRAHLTPLRFAGLTVAIGGAGFALAIGSDERSRAMHGNSVNAASVVVFAVACAASALGLFLYARGRRTASHALFRLLTQGASSIRTLRVIGLTNRPFSWVFVGLAGGKERQLTVPGDARSALALFLRIAPQAQVVATPDRRPSGPSAYDR